MPLKSTYDDQVYVRCFKTDKEKFEAECAKIGHTSSTMIREAMIALNEGRLRIVKPPQSEKKGNLYVSE